MEDEVGTGPLSKALVEKIAPNHLEKTQLSKKTHIRHQPGRHHPTNAQWPE
jgi:hypothetical protein